MTGVTPPTRRPEVVLGLALVADRTGRDLQRYVRAAGSADALWRYGNASLARVLGLTDGPAHHALMTFRRGEDVRVAEGRLADAGIRVVTAGDPLVPGRLREIFDPPIGLFVEGDWPATAAGLAEAPAIAIVGSRRPSAMGARFARDLAAALAGAGAVIVSGLAAGIDAAAHEGALDAGGRTVAVLGCGLGHGYPRRNRRLRERIAGSGAVMSEYWQDTPPAPWRFPARNRIVAGLSHAVVVVEAAERSGALITVDFALEAGRTVLAVPGSPSSETSRGCNALLRTGAAVCCGADDVRVEVPHPGWVEPPGVVEEPPSGFPARVHALLAEGPLRADELADRLAADPAAVAAALAALEIDGHALRGEGQRFWATPRVR